MKVKFYPKNYFTTSVCNHKHNADFTFTECTDTGRESSSNIMEMYGFRNNLKLSMYISKYSALDEGASDREKTGLIKHNIYFIGGRWRNPSTGILEYIPDYTSLVWTQAGVDAFGVVLGESKSYAYPQHGQEMYDLTSGALGYDYMGGVSGASNQLELTASIEDQNDFYFAKFNKNTSSISWQGGNDDSSISMIPYYLGGRNSKSISEPLIDPSNTYYGFGLGHNENADTETLRSRYTSYISSLRWWDKYQIDGATAVNNKITSEIPATIANNGWFRDFIHWHELEAAGTLPLLDSYLALVRSNISTDKVYSASSGDALEYLFLREIVNRVSAQEKDGRIYIVTDVVDEFKEQITSGISGGLDLDTISQSLSVKIDITGSTLVGSNLKANFGKLINLGGNEFIVEIPFNKKEQFQSVVLSVADGGYYDTAQPTANENTVNNVLTIESDMKCKAVLFRVLSGGAEIDYKIFERSNEFSEIHNFTVSGSYDYKVGILSEFGEANLINIT